jgi:hypothetical protein
MAPAGALAVTLDRTAAVNQTITLNTGTAYCALLQLIAGLTISNLNFWVTTTGAGGTSGFAAILSVNAAGSATVAAVSSAFTAGSAFGSLGQATISLTAAYTPPVTGAYYAAIMQYAAPTKPVLVCGTGVQNNSFATAAPTIAGSYGGGLLTGPPTVGTSVGVIGGLNSAAHYCWLT